MISQQALLQLIKKQNIQAAKVNSKNNNKESGKRQTAAKYYRLQHLTKTLIKREDNSHRKI